MVIIAGRSLYVRKLIRSSHSNLQEINSSMFKACGKTSRTADVVACALTFCKGRWNYSESIGLGDALNYVTMIPVEALEGNEPSDASHVNSISFGDTMVPNIE